MWVKHLTVGEARLYFGLYIILAWIFVVRVGVVSASLCPTERRSPARMQTYETPTIQTFPTPTTSRKGGTKYVLTNREVSNAVAGLCGVDSGLLWSLAMRESSGRHYDSRGRVLRSRSGALGMFQVKPGTAAGLGLSAHDRWENALAGACYYRQMLDRFSGDPHRALVAYHRGPNGGTSAASREYADDILQREIER